MFQDVHGPRARSLELILGPVLIETGPSLGFKNKKFGLMHKNTVRESQTWCLCHAIWVCCAHLRKMVIIHFLVYFAGAFR